MTVCTCMVPNTIKSTRFKLMARSRFSNRPRFQVRLGRALVPRTLLELSYLVFLPHSFPSHTRPRPDVLWCPENVGVRVFVLSSRVFQVIYLPPPHHTHSGGLASIRPEHLSNSDSHLHLLPTNYAHLHVQVHRHR